MANTKPVKRIKLDSKKKSSAKKVETKKVSATKNMPKVALSPRGASFVTAPLRSLWGYLSGSWRELRQVRWPNRSATWSLTFAVIAFTIFFTVVILALDAAFQYLFKEVLFK